MIGNTSAVTFDEESNLWINGETYVYDSDANYIDTIENPTPQMEFRPPDWEDTFGLIMAALPDGKFIVADPMDDHGGIDQGALYVFNPVEDTPTNTAPDAGPIVGQSDAVRQQTIHFSGSFSDADSGDLHTVSWDFGDGNVIAAHSTDDPARCRSAMPIRAPAITP